MSHDVAVVVGDVINDIVVRALAPTAVGSDTPAVVARCPGGSGANQAAWMGALGAAVRFIGRAGTGDIAEHRQALAAAGVDARIAVDSVIPTGTIVVLVGTDGERSMFTYRGASALLSDSDVPADVLDGASLLHVSAYQLFSQASRHAVLQLWHGALTSGLATSIDPSSVAGLLEVGVGEFLEWTTGARLVFPNLGEGRLLTGESTPDAIVDSLLEVYEVVALKLGPDGALVADRAGRRARVPAVAREVVDSTGAGDAFCAGFLTAWLDGAVLDVAAGAAVSAAGRAVGHLGGRPALPPSESRPEGEDRR